MKTIENLISNKGVSLLAGIRVFLSIAMFWVIVLLSTGAQAQQKVTKDTEGNYSVTRRDTAAKDTDHTLTDADGKKHPIYQSSTGKLYWLRVSKAGNTYKAYIKV